MQTKLSFSFNIPVTIPISPAALAAFAWDINVPIVISVPKRGRNNKCFYRSVEAGEDSRSWRLEASEEGLADELKREFGVTVISLTNHIMCAR